MLNTQTSGDITIQPGTTIHFTNHGRRRLSFRAGGGFVWLTRDGDIKDYLLYAGDAISLYAGDHVWMTLENTDQAGAVTLEPLETPVSLWGEVAARFSAGTVRPRGALVEARA